MWFALLRGGHPRMQLNSGLRCGADFLVNASRLPCLSCPGLHVLPARLELLVHELSLLAARHCWCHSSTMFYTGNDHETNLLEFRTVLHQVYVASLVISIHMDTSIESLQHPFRRHISLNLCITLLVSTSPACSVTGEQVFHSCRDDGLRLSDCRVNSRHVLWWSVCAGLLELRPARCQPRSPQRR